MSVQNGAVRVTVKDIQDAIGQLHTAFSELKAPADAAAKPLEKFANALGKLQNVSSSFNKINFKASDIEKAIPTISDETKKKINSFVKSINEAVPANSLKKFQSISQALRSFTSVFKDFIELKNKFNEFTGFLDLMSTPDTKGGHDTPFIRLVELISAYVNSIGSIGARSQQGLEETENAKSKLNPMIQGITDIFNTIKTLSASLIALSSNDAQAGLNALQTIKDRIIAFVTRIGSFAVSGFQIKDVNGVQEYVPILNQKVQGFIALIDAIKPLATLLPKLSLVEDARKNFIATRDAIIEFVTGFSLESSTGLIPLDDKAHQDWATKYSGILTSIKNGIRSLTEITSVLEKLSSILPKITLIEEARNNLKQTRQAIIDFVKGFFIEQDSSLPAISGDSSNSNLLISLKNGLIVISAITSVFTKLSSALPKLALVENARKNFSETRQAIIDFVKGFFIEGDVSSLSPFDSSRYKAFLESLRNGLYIMAAITEVLTKLSSSVPKLALIEEARNNFKATQKAIVDFVKGFAKFDTVADAKDIVYGLKNMAGISMILDKYTAVLKNLSKLSTLVSSTFNWSDARDSIFKFIKGFDPDPALANELAVGLKNMVGISVIFDKYASIMRSLSKIGHIDFTTIGNSFTSFLTSVSTAFQNSNLASLSNDVLKKLSLIGNSLRGMASFMNSVTKGFSNKNIGDSVAKIEEFINQMARLSKLSTFPDFERVANSVGKFNGKLQDANETVRKSNQAWTKFKSIMRQIYTAFVGGAVIYSIVRGIKSAIKEMYDLEYAMARVNTIARVSESTLKDMTHKVQEMSSTFGIESAKVSKALYDINSATIKGAASMKILEQSAALAVAGFTDIEKVSDLIAKAVNAYQYNIQEAAHISDILFVTVERGINPMEELSEYMGRLFTVSANAGVSLEEVGAGLATLTARGYQTNVASTALNSAILKLSTGTKELNKLFQQYGYASSASALRTIGLGGVLEILNKATGGATEKLHDLGFNYRDIRAATTLASSAIDEYNKTLTMMTDKNYTANKTAEALAKVQDTVKFKFDKLKATFTVFIQTISEYMNKNTLLKKTLQGIINVLNDIIDSMRGLQLTFKDQLLASIITFIPKLVATYGILTLFTPLFSKLGTGIAMITAAVKKQEGAVLALNTSLKAAATSAGKLIALYAVVQGASKTAGWIEQINEAGTWNPGANTANGLSWGEALQASFASMVGGVGNAIDWVLGTDFAERIYDALKPDAIEYVDRDAVAKSREHEGEYNKSLFASKMGTDIIPMLRDWNPLFEGLDESFITEVYNKLSEQLQAEAKLRKISAEDLKAAQDQLNAWRDKAFSLNDEISKLLPNVKAMRDVFEEASKSIADASEKYAGEFEKSIGKFAGVNDAINTLVSGTGLSVEQIQSGMSSVGNLDVLKKMLRKQDIIEAFDIEDAIEPFIGDFITSIEGYELKVANAINRVYLNPETTKDYFDFLRKYRELTGNYNSNVSWSDLINGMQQYPELAKFFENVSSEVKKAFDTFVDFQKNPEDMLKNPVEQIISYLSTIGVIDEEQKAKLEKEKDDIINRWLRLPDNYKNDPNYVANLIADTLSDPKIREAVSYLSQNFSEVAKGMNKLRKELVDFGNAVQELNSQKISISDIVNNTFNLTSVSELKNMLKVKLYDPETLATLGSDKINESVSKYLSTALIGLRKKLSRDEILKELEQQMLQDDAHLKTLSPEERKKIIGSILDAGKGIVDFYSDFAKQLSELDFMKFMNKLKFGGEMSVWKQYELSDKFNIEEILKEDVRGFGSFREALNKAEKVGFEEMRKLLGDEGWSDFATLFNKLNKVWSGSSSALMTEYKNIQKRIKKFINQYQDAFLTPIQQFNKTSDLLERQLRRLKRQAKKGTINPEDEKATLDTIEKLYKMSEQMMSIKVPASITASEAVRTGSKEAFDMVATNVFRDIYKVNVQQRDLQKRLVDVEEDILAMTQQSKGRLGIIGKGV